MAKGGEQRVDYKVEYKVERKNRAERNMDDIIDKVRAGPKAI
jgi:hypothetical protein